MNKPKVTPAGIEPVTFRFVAQHLNQGVTAIWHLQTYTNSGAKINFATYPRNAGVFEVPTCFDPFRSSSGSFVVAC